MKTRESDWIGLFDENISVEEAVRFVTEPSAGGIDVFIGTTRAERHSDGRELLRLDYEAYPEMALKVMRELAAGARSRFPIAKLAILHRTGPVGVGQASVVIAVACPHRSEAFDACRFLIDRLKAEVPIWKKEIWSNQTSTWVDPAG